MVQGESKESSAPPPSLPRRRSLGGEVGERGASDRMPGECVRVAEAGLFITKNNNNQEQQQQLLLLQQPPQQPTRTATTTSGRAEYGGERRVGRTAVRARARVPAPLRPARPMDSQSRNRCAGPNQRAVQPASTITADRSRALAAGGTTRGRRSACALARAGRDTWIVLIGMR